MPPRGNFDDIIRDTYRTHFGKLKDEEADMEMNSNPQRYPQEQLYLPGGILEMLRGLEHPYEPLIPPFEPENIYNFRDTTPQKVLSRSANNLVHDTGWTIR